MKKLNHNGAAHYLLLFVIVVLVIVGVGYYVWERSEDENDSDNNRPVNRSAAAETCSGDWYDTHTHLDDDELPVKLAENMKTYDVGCAVLFVQMNPDDYDEDLELAQEILGDSPAVFVPFMDVIKNNNSPVTKEYLEKVYKDTGGKLKGFGEFALYRPELKYADITGEPWSTIYKFAAEKDLFVMIHMDISSESKAMFESVAGSYPNTKFLIHGFEQGPEGFAALLKKYSNVYFTLDTATLLTDGMGTHLMYPNDKGSVKQFESQLSENRARLLSRAKNEWSKVVITAPDRVLWGTDASYDWHADASVYKALIEFSEEFRASLPKDVQDKYAYQNAVKLFGNKALYFEPADDHGDDLSD